MATDAETNIFQLPITQVLETPYETNGDFLLKAQDTLGDHDLTDWIRQAEAHELSYQGHAYFKELFAPTQLAEDSPSTAQRLASVFVGCTAKEIEPGLGAEALSRLNDMYDGKRREAEKLLANALGEARREDASHKRARLLATIIKHLDQYLM
jgi:hypothetical protein